MYAAQPFNTGQYNIPQSYNSTQPPQRLPYAVSQAQTNYPPPQGGYPNPYAQYQPTNINTYPQPGQVGVPMNSQNLPANVYSNQAQQPQATQQGQWYSHYYNQIQPQELQSLQAWFARVDSDRSGTIEAEELQHVTFDRLPIGLEVSRKLVQVFDKDRSGNIDFIEYASMHKFISHMRQAFVAADADRSGRIDAREIHQALANAGFSYLSMSSILELLHKFDRTRLGLDWREFLLMVSHIALVRSVYEWNDKQKRGFITLTEDQFTQVSAFLLPVMAGTPPLK